MTHFLAIQFEQIHYALEPEVYEHDAGLHYAHRPATNLPGGAGVQSVRKAGVVLSSYSTGCWSHRLVDHIFKLHRLDKHGRCIAAEYRLLWHRRA